ncbi:hypothetical protein MMC13_001197 [Lambiella insularis]|nr:hypothetical protein [Lambiella insularis]
MDMQGTPIGSTNQGMKNTTDPSAKIPVQEKTGPVASDSLAAESIRSGGGFAENKNAAALGVSGNNSTLANDDISGATTLPPARDARERETQSEQQATSSTSTGSEGSKGNNTKGREHTSDSSTGSEGMKGNDATGGEPDVSSKSYADTAGDSTSSAGGQTASSDSDTAPSYVIPQTTENIGKPKGKNITEGGFEGDSSNTAGFAEPGSEDDPGRTSLQGFQIKQAATVGSGPRQGKVTGDGQYDMLADDQKLE